MAALGLGSYDSDAESDDEGDVEPPRPLMQPADDVESDEEEDAAESEAAEEAAAAEEQPIGPVVPLALSGAGGGDDDDDDDDDDDGPQAVEDEEEEAPSRLPAPDFSDWALDPEYAGGARASAPQVTALGKRERPKGGPHQISKGFSAAVTRHDQLKAKAEADLADAAEVRGRNNGLSSAYDSVFHVPESEMTEDELDRQKRMRTTRKGGVRMISKKEAAKEAALEASLM